MTFFWGILILLVGFSIGSFINVILYRMPKRIDFLTSRSKCPSCSLQLKWFDLIPLISFILLNGKCRSCKQKISLGYFFVELIAGFLTLAVFLVFRDNIWSLILWMSVVNTIFLLALFDMRYFILPDKILITIFLLVAIFYTLDWLKIIESTSISPLQSLVGAVIGLAILGSFWLFSKGKWMGFGDVKFAFVLGYIFGIYGGLIVIYVGSLIGGGLGIILLINHKASFKTKMPFGTFLGLSAILYIIFQIPIKKLIFPLWL